MDITLYRLDAEESQDRRGNRGSGFTSLPDDGKKGFDFGWVSLPLMFVLEIIIGFVINKVRKH